MYKAYRAYSIYDRRICRYPDYLSFSTIHMWIIVFCYPNAPYPHIHPRYHQPCAACS